MECENSIYGSVCVGVIVPKTEKWLPKCKCQEAGQSGWSWQKMCLPKQSIFEALKTGREGWNNSSQTPPPPQRLLLAQQPLFSSKLSLEENF